VHGSCTAQKALRRVGGEGSPGWKTTTRRRGEKKK